MQLQWAVKPFNDLTLNELYESMRLRSAVFVVEQNCPGFLDMDGLDQGALHVIGQYNNKVVAYMRLLKAGVEFDEPSFGRVCVEETFRKNRLGGALMDCGLRGMVEHFGDCDITIDAQLYLKQWYEKYGFVQWGDMHILDDIEHIRMKKSK